MEYSKYQKAIFNFIESGKGNANVVAVAGSGKTTTIKKGYELARGSVIFLAFNRSIADTLKAEGLNARTFHSLGYGPVTQAVGKRVDGQKLDRLLKSNLNSEDEYFWYRSFCRRLVSLGKQVGIGTHLCPDEYNVWLDLVDHYNLDVTHREATIDRGIEISRDLLSWSNSANYIDYDDMLYKIVQLDLKLKKYDFVFVDEAQDTNPIQRELLRRIMKPKSRLIAVGDPCQAIYGFRGADSDSMDQLAREFNSIELPLSISYRCPKKIVEYSQQWVEHIEAADNADDGEVNHLGAWDVLDFKPADLVVCRKTAPLISLAYKMLGARVPVQILGRDIATGLINIIKKQKALDIDNLYDKLELYREKEVGRLLRQQKEAQAEALADKIEAINVLMEGCDTIDCCIETINNLFEDKSAAIILCTIHKAKGLEAERVFWLDRFDCPMYFKGQRPWEAKQELNICYVAATRAKKSLNLISLENIG